MSIENHHFSMKKTSFFNGKSSYVNRKASCFNGKSSYVNGKSSFFNGKIIIIPTIVGPRNPRNLRSVAFVYPRTLKLYIEIHHFQGKDHRFTLKSHHFHRRPHLKLPHCPHHLLTILRGDGVLQEIARAFNLLDEHDVVAAKTCLNTCLTTSE